MLVSPSSANFANLLSKRLFEEESLDTVRWKARLEKIKATNNHSSLIRVWSKYGGLIRKKIAHIPN